MTDEIEVAVRVASALERAGVEYVLGGSVASSLQGEPRATNDIDFAVRLSEIQIPKLVAELGSDFEVDVEGLRDAVRRRRSWNIYLLAPVTKVDLFVRGGIEFDDSELARKVRVQLSPDMPQIFVSSPEDNLLRKLLWFKQRGGESELQWRDVVGIVRVSGPSLDRAYLHEWARRLDVADLLDKALATEQ